MDNTCFVKNNISPSLKYFWEMISSQHNKELIVMSKDISNKYKLKVREKYENLSLKKNISTIFIFEYIFDIIICKFEYKIYINIWK